MMHERRQEPFRYTFQNPLPGFFFKRLAREVSGPLTVEDISLSGLRFSCSGRPELQLKDEISLSFILEHETFSADGRVIWLESDGAKTMCGIHVFAFPIRLTNKIEQFGSNLTTK